MTVLTTTTRLFCIFAVNVNRRCKCLFVSNLRSADICLYVKLTQQTVYNDLQMKFSHSGDDRLTRLRIGMRAESRIFLCQFGKGLTHLTLVILCLRLDRKLDNWLWEFHRLQDNRMLLVTDRITCRRQFKPYCRSNITGINLIDLIPFIGVHLNDTSHTLFLAFRRIQHIRTRIQRTRIYTEKREFTNKWVSHDLKCQCRERLVIRRFTCDLISLFIRSCNIRNIGRSRHIFDHAVQHLLYTLIFISRTTIYRNSFTSDRSFAERLFQIVYRRFFIL